MNATRCIKSMTARLAWLTAKVDARFGHPHEEAKSLIFAMETILETYDVPAERQQRAAIAIDSYRAHVVDLVGQTKDRCTSPNPSTREVGRALPLE